MDFETLFQPGRIGQLRIKNRLVMPAMATNYAAEDGSVTRRLIDYYAERARGGVGLIITEVTDIQRPLGSIMKRQLAVDDDRLIPGLRRLTTAIHRHRAKVFMQLHHAGRRADTVHFHQQPVAPSPMPVPGGAVPRGLAPEEMADIVARFAAGARRAQQAGFDGVELHAAHGYLISQFLSAAFNKRTDKYGGSLTNRARLLLEVFQAIRAETGPDFPICCRISAQEYGFEGGITLNEAIRTARLIEKAGADAIHVSGWPVSSFRYPPMAEPPGTMLHLAAAIKQAVGLPVIAVGRITPELAERALAQGEADFVAMGRALIADPHLPFALATGRPEHIRPCVGCLICNEHFSNNETGDAALRCAVNPAVGKERATKARWIRTRKAALVVGGGPGGMTAAITAARRGYQVTLCERSDRLGGQLNLAVVPPYKSGWASLLDYMKAQLKSWEVEVKLNTEVTVQYIRDIAPYAVVLATGATPYRPQIPGIADGNIICARDLLSGKSQAGQRVVVIGGQRVACETAEYLAAMGKDVVILGRQRPIGQEIVPEYGRRLILGRLQQAGGTLVEHVEVTSIDKAGVHTRKDGAVKLYPADTVVLAAGSTPDNTLAQQLADRAGRIYHVGDCVTPRGIAEAIEEGFLAARSI